MALSAILKRQIEEDVITKDIFVSTRFVNDDGSIEPFKIKQLTSEDEAKINKTVTRRMEKPAPGVTPEEIYLHELILTSTVYPNFHSKEVQDAVGCFNALDALRKLLTRVEMEVLVDNIKQFMEEEREGIDALKNE